LSRTLSVPIKKDLSRISNHLFVDLPFDGLHLHPGELSWVGNGDLSLFVEECIGGMEGVTGVAFGKELEALPRHRVSHTGAAGVFGFVLLSHSSSADGREDFIWIYIGF
jgi:hypothetical protein